MTSRRSPLRAVGAGILASASLSASAQPPSNALAGNWTHVRLREPADSAIGCRYVMLEIREYELAPGWNAEVNGNYQRRIRPLWIEVPRPAPVQCPARGGSTDLPGWRIDNWSVQGMREADGSLRLRGFWTQCAGPACDGNAQLHEQFETVLTSRPGGAADSGGGSAEGSLRLTASGEIRADESEASNAFTELLRPLREGDCSRFHAESMDPALSSGVAPDQFCEPARAIGALLALSTHESPNPDPARISLGILNGAPPFVVLDGDVLVVRNFVIDAGGTILTLAALMRKQTDGRWKIRLLFLQ